MAAPFVWFDLTTASGDSVGVRDFYMQLFGWTIGPGMGDYQGIVTEGEQPWAGWSPWPVTTRTTGGRCSITPPRRPDPQEADVPDDR
jgi:hypothetical protein